MKKDSSHRGSAANDGSSDAQQEGDPGAAVDGSAQEMAVPADPPPAQRAVDELQDKYLRLAADYDNFRRRTAKERIESAARGQAELVKQMLEALDDLARFAHLDPASTDAAAVVQGAALVERKLLKALTAAGLTIVNPAEQPFDPAQHEAVATEPALSPEDDHLVARVYQPGYLFNGQLLRPARVVVKQWNPA